jgi:hypothetical protein
MKKLAIALTALLAAAPAFADTVVNGYIRRDGTYVRPHVRSSPNGYRYDNWSTGGNINPYTGTRGTTRTYDSFGNDCTGWC